MIYARNVAKYINLEARDYPGKRKSLKRNIVAKYLVKSRSIFYSVKRRVNKWLKLMHRFRTVKMQISCSLNGDWNSTT